MKKLRFVFQVKDLSDLRKHSEPLVFEKPDNNNYVIPLEAIFSLDAGDLRGVVKLHSYDDKKDVFETCIFRETPLSTTSVPSVSAAMLSQGWKIVTDLSE